MNYKKHIVLAVAILAIGTIANAQSTNGITVPAVTPTLTGAANLSIGLLTNTPSALGATALADVTGWFISHGQIVSGVGITAGGLYGATVGQAVQIFATTNVDEFVWSIRHDDFYCSKVSGAQDEFGTGFSYTFDAPAWLNNFVIITKKPSQFTVGLTVDDPTTRLVKFKFRKSDVLFAPSIGWKF